MKRDDLDALVAGVEARRVGAIARLISWAEDRDPRIDEALRRLYPRTGAAHRIGVTGPPGAGKSTLIARLAQRLRADGNSVAILAVDPTSPFTGGALLGDRIRMTELVEDPEIFLRSMATRGSLGGLAGAADEALDLLDAAGYERLIVETVGVGQVELDIAMATDTVVVVLVPESGDGIQAMKAGLMEIGDVFVVNKADRDGADRLVDELESVLDLRPEGPWRPPVVRMAALQGRGADELHGALDRHREHLAGDGRLQGHRREAARERVLAALRTELFRRARSTTGAELDAWVDRVAERQVAPGDAARALARDLLAQDGPA